MNITLPLDEATARSLRAGDNVLLFGPMFVARDAAHKRLIALLAEGLPLPFSIQGETIYYAGPSPAPAGRIIGSAGPTTSGRMDRYTPQLLDLGLRCTIGKGRRSQEVLSSMKKNAAVYLGVTGGAAALIANCVTRSEVVCYEDLGPEAVRRIWVEGMPAVVLADTLGNDLYELGKKQYRQPLEP
jgi:fumarate hydratase subunit beta